MSFLKKAISFMAVFVIVPNAFAATARPSITATVANRVPTMVVRTVPGVAAAVSTLTTVTVRECVEAYTGCLRASDVCGPNFEECTNKTLFFSKRPLCASTLMQCDAAGITNLFGSATQTAFSNKNVAGEYIYPMDGSALAQLIEAAHVSNRYDTSQCVRRYMTCLKKDDVCGADFELCTTNTEFKKQKLFCESTLARCQEAGVTELFGRSTSAQDPIDPGRIAIAIREGGALAAVNAVATCYKVTDQCILNACAQNPYKCREGSNKEVAQIVETITAVDGTTTTTISEDVLGAVNRNEISGFIKKACQDTIGGNKFCYATTIGNGSMPTDSQIRDEDNRSEVYAEAYSSRWNESMRSKIEELVERFDKKTKQRCQDTIVSCAMRACGEGSGATCYSQAFPKGESEQGVTRSGPKSDIKAGCEAIVNNDAACKYAAATFSSTTGVLAFEEQSLFDKLFTAADDTDTTRPDAVGAVATLNARLSSSYNQAALDNMRRQCQAVATGCVKTMCGTEYTNCYRNRTDVYSTLTTGNSNDSAGFTKSMNKVGGVLDYTIVLGLCVNTVKTSPVCEEHLKTEAARISIGRNQQSDSVWGGAASVRSGWLDSGALNLNVTVDSYQDTDVDGNPLCTASAPGCGSGTGICNESFKVGDTICIYDEKFMISSNEYNINKAAEGIFTNVLYDVEKEVQGIYNAKLTRQQNMCISGNNGGIIGARDLGGTFQWVKLRNSKVPNSYATKGLTTNQFVASNDIYGSFCRIRVTLQSDDKRIQDAISSGRDWGVAYFAAGDAFTCGSWIPQSALESISGTVGKAAREEATRGDSRTRTWMTLLGTIGGGVGGGFATNALQKGGLGGLLKTTNRTGDNTYSADQCKRYIANYKAQTDGEVAHSYTANITSVAKDLGIESADPAIRNAINASQDAQQAARAAREAAARAAAATATPQDKEAEGLARSTAADKKKFANAAMDAVERECTARLDKPVGSSKTVGNLIGAGVGAIAGGVLAYQATKSIQNASADNAENRAMKEWMEEVGNHIRCYIGPDEVGVYGDTISTEME
jgi:hypothetical protein